MRRQAGIDERLERLVAEWREAWRRQDELLLAGLGSSTQRICRDTMAARGKCAPPPMTFSAFIGMVGPALRTPSRLGKGPSGQVYLGSVEPPPEGTRYFQL
jgi:hypothetical protein